MSHVERMNEHKGLLKNSVGIPKIGDVELPIVREEEKDEKCISR